METAAQYNRNDIIETTSSRRGIASARLNSSTHSNEQVQDVETYKSLNLCVLSSARIERRTFRRYLVQCSRHVFSTCRLVDWWNCFAPDAVFVRRCFDTVLTARGAAHKGGSYANPDAACRRGPANCRGTSLRSRSECSGPIAFARSLRPVAEYFGPKARCGGSRHRAGGESQAGFHSRGSPLRQGAHCE